MNEKRFIFQISTMEGKSVKLYHWIFIGMIAGILTGFILQIAYGPGMTRAWLPQAILSVMDIIGKIFIRLLQMIIIPLVVSSIIVGTAGLGNIRHLGRLGGRILMYYIGTTAIAVTIGLFLVNTFQPGKYVPEELRDKLRSEVQETQQPLNVKPPSITDVITGIVPKNPFKDAVEGKLLSLIFFSILFGIGITLIDSKKGELMFQFFDGITDVCIQIVHMIMLMAPIGVWALLGSVVAKTGFGILKSLLWFSILFLVGLLIQWFGVYSASLRFLSKEKPLPFFSKISEALVVAFSTSSSSATLPVSLQVAQEDLEIPEKIAGFVLPLGATINMDGTALYQGVVTVFLAQLFGIPLHIGDQITIILTATLASIGAAGVPSAGLITLIIVLKSIGFSQAVISLGIGLILGVDRILDMCRTVVNVSGDLVATRYIYEVDKKSVTSRQTIEEASL